MATVLPEWFNKLKYNAKLKEKLKTDQAIGTYISTNLNDLTDTNFKGELIKKKYLDFMNNALIEDDKATDDVKFAFLKELLPDNIETAFPEISELNTLGDMKKLFIILEKLTIENNNIKNDEKLTKELGELEKLKNKKPDTREIKLKARLKARLRARLANLDFKSKMNAKRMEYYQEANQVINGAISEVNTELEQLPTISGGKRRHTKKTKHTKKTRPTKTIPKKTIRPKKMRPTKRRAGKSSHAR